MAGMPGESRQPRIVPVQGTFHVNTPRNTPKVDLWIEDESGDRREACSHRDGVIRQVLSALNVCTEAAPARSGRLEIMPQIV